MDGTTTVIKRTSWYETSVIVVTELMIAVSISICIIVTEAYVRLCVLELILIRPACLYVHV